MKRLVTHLRVFIEQFIAERGIERSALPLATNGTQERSPNSNPVFPQFPRLPLFKEILKILTKLRKKFLLSILFIKLLRTITNKVCLKSGTDFCKGCKNVPRIWGRLLPGGWKYALDSVRTSAQGVETFLRFRSGFTPVGFHAWDSVHTFPRWEFHARDFVQDLPWRGKPSPRFRAVFSDLRMVSPNLW